MLACVRVAQMVGNCLWALLLGGVLLGAASAQAVPLGLVPQRPDIVGEFIDLNYDAGANLFTATGDVAVLKAPGNVVWPVLNGGAKYQLSAVIDDAGVATSGSLWIGGDIPGLSANEPLITGTLETPDGFGYDPQGGKVFEFLFHNTGGSLSSYFGPRIGVIMTLNQNGAFTGSFGASFGDSFVVTDNFVVPIPEPATMLLAPAALAGLGLTLWRRRVAP